jgi:hypothetical protein
MSTNLKEKNATMFPMKREGYQENALDGVETGR